MSSILYVLTHLLVGPSATRLTWTGVSTQMMWPLPDPRHLHMLILAMCLTKRFSVWDIFCNFHKLLKGEASALRPTAGFRQRPWIHLPLPVHSSGLNSSLTWFNLILCRFWPPTLPNWVCFSPPWPTRTFSTRHMASEVFQPPPQCESDLLLFSSVTWSSFFQVYEKKHRAWCTLLEGTHLDQY